jgi:uncharacterized phage-like protein YoqJ
MALAKKEANMLQSAAFFTGHRPPDLGGWNEDNDVAREVKAWLIQAIERAYVRGKRVFISGLATGTDMWAGEAVIALKEQHHDIELYAAIPFPSQASKWAEFNKKRWKRLKEEADSFTILFEDPSKDSPTWAWASLLHQRNQWMVKNGSVGIAVWNGKEKGGTFDCLKKAKAAGRPILRYDPLTQKEEWLFV